MEIDFKKIPLSAGVYLFKNRDGEILYIGKAKNLRKRIRNHFSSENQFLAQGIEQVEDIDWIETDTSKDALLLERELIRKYHPKFNIEWKDDKGYFFVGVGNGDFPYILWTHQPKDKAKKFIGPFVNGRELKQVLFNLRDILPYRSCRKLPKKPCLWFDLGKCVGICKKRKTESLREKYSLLIRTLEEILKVYLGKSGRLECYDISNISGNFASGAMVVFERNKKVSSQYRLFKIKRAKSQDDVACLREIILRRLKHKEWKNPDLIVLDGGKAQLKAVKKLDIPTITLAKEKRKKIFGKIYSPFSKKELDLKKLPSEISSTLLALRDEAHRFAITYHKKRRKKYLFEEV
ncbi:GIY-YIG nuclease family protein [bacterium]|nr:GIY-YIG nuclease family protein [bacterium]